MAACVGQDPEEFFPFVSTPVLTVNAKATCRACPVKNECLVGSFEDRETFGVWGGLSEDQRRKLGTAILRNSSGQIVENLIRELRFA